MWGTTASIKPAFEDITHFHTLIRFSNISPKVNLSSRPEDSLNHMRAISRTRERVGEGPRISVHIKEPMQLSMRLNITRRDSNAIRPCY